MATLEPGVTAAMAALRDRWGAAAPRQGTDDGVGEVVGSLATVPLPSAAPLPAPSPATGRIVSTGFAALDAILGPGGLPRPASVGLRGDHSSGKTTLAFRLAAETQAAGGVVAWLDLDRSLDPVEAVARGVRLEWLVLLAPATLEEALAMAGALLGGRAVDLLVLDLPAGPWVGRRPGPPSPGPPSPGPPGPGPHRSRREPGVPDRLHRLAALARRADVLLVVLEPPGLPAGLGSAVAEATGLRLELRRRDWIRLGRDVVGQRTEVAVARNRFGPPGRRAELRILYADGGERDACLLRPALLGEPPPGTATRPLVHPNPHPIPVRDANPPSALATSPDRARPASLDGEPPRLRALPGGPDRPRRPAVDRRARPGRRRVGAGPRDPARHPARGGAPARPGGDVPRS